MQPLFDIKSLSDLSPNDSVPFKCEYCGACFYVKVKYLRGTLNLDRTDRIRFCNQSCFHKFKSRESSKLISCKNCKKDIRKTIGEMRKSKNYFCSKSCAATYNNTHKTKGTRRSKLERWIEEKITNDFGGLEVLFNNKEAIGSELDIYFPTLNLAVELNGIYHYEPIHGQEKLASIQNNDNRKFQACLEHGIELVIIDTSSLKYFKEERAIKFYNIIKNVMLFKWSRCWI